MFDKSTKVDLHMHTIASDGTWTPKEIFENIIRENIKIFSITDHNSINSVQEVYTYAKKAGLTFIPGVEIDSTCENITYHILGYGIDHMNQSLNNLLSKNMNIYRQRDRESIEIIEKKFDVSLLNEYEHYVNNPKRGGWKSINFLVDKKFCKTYKDLWGLFEGFKNPYIRKNFSQPEKVIKIIRKAGGKAVLAHPGANLYGNDYKKAVRLISEAGIDGIECYHPDNNQEVSNYCIEFCKKNNLLITGGSDCHGDFVVERSLGQPDVRFGMINIKGIIKQ